jgi:hypothetical protein
MLLVLVAALGVAGCFGLGYLGIGPFSHIAPSQGGSGEDAADPSGHAASLLGDRRLAILEGDPYLIAGDAVWRLSGGSGETLGVAGARSLLAEAGSVFIATENEIYRYQPQIGELSKVYGGGVSSFALAAPYLMISDSRGAVARVHIPSLEISAFAPEGTAGELLAVGGQLIYRDFEGDGVSAVQAAADPQDFEGEELESGVTQAAVSGDLLYLATPDGVTVLNSELEEAGSFDSPIPEGAFFAGGYWYYGGGDGISRVENGGKEEVLLEDGDRLLSADADYLLTESVLYQIKGGSAGETLVLEDLGEAASDSEEDMASEDAASGREASSD